MFARCGAVHENVRDSTEGYPQVNITTMDTLRQLRSFGAHRRLIKICNKKHADHWLRICFLFYISYLIILFSLQCVLILQREIQGASILTLVWELIQLFFWYKWIYERSYTHNTSVQWDANPRPLRYRCSALPTELSSQLGYRFGVFWLLSLKNIVALPLIFAKVMMFSLRDYLVIKSPCP